MSHLGLSDLIGRRVRIPRGTMVRRYGPDWPIKTEPAKRAQTVRVRYISETLLSVEWIGRGGYSRMAKVDDVEVLDA
jgi:hypothetical protein